MKVIGEISKQSGILDPSVNIMLNDITLTIDASSLSRDKRDVDPLEDLLDANIDIVDEYPFEEAKEMIIDLAPVAPSLKFSDEPLSDDNVEDDEEYNDPSEIIGIYKAN